MITAPYDLVWHGCSMVKTSDGWSQKMSSVILGADRPTALFTITHAYLQYNEISF